jgi:hypothetical protein
MTSRLIIAATGTLLLSSLAGAAELKVLSTQATEEAIANWCRSSKRYRAQGHDGLHRDARRQQAAGGR